MRFRELTLNNLNRFLLAHQYNYKNALREITDGHKRTHWIWFIFPQLAVLGRSTVSPNEIFRDVLDDFYNGTLDKKTLDSM